MGATAVAHAQETTAPSAVLELDPVVVTSQRGNQTNTVVRARRIEVEQAVNLQDLFKQTPEVTASGGIGAAQKLYVRGLGERMLTVTIDGATQPEATYHHASQVMIEPELIKRVEIEAGTGAATAGPGALAGALRFTTKSALDLLQPGERAGALLKGAWQSSSEGKKATATVFGRVNDELDLLVSGTRFRAGNYQDGDGNDVPHSASSVDNVFLKAGLRLAEDTRLEFGYEDRVDDGFRTVKTNLLPAPFNPGQPQRAKHRSATVNLDHAGPHPHINLHATAYVNRNTFLLDAFQPKQETNSSKTEGLNVVNVSTHGLHTLSYGFDFRRDIGSTDTAAGAQPDDVAEVHGVFVQDDLVLSRQWRLALGGRYDRYTYDDKAGQSFDSNGFSPSANLAWQPTRDVTLRLGHARALRGVGIIEPFLKAFQDNAPGLQPEKAANTELSAHWTRGPWQATATAFHQEVRNYINFGEVGRENVGTVKANGYSASAGYKVPQWGASLGVSQSRPNLNGTPLTDGDSLLLGTATGRTWVGQLDWEVPRAHVGVGWTARLIEKLTHVPAGSDEKAGYSVHDVYARWQPLGTDRVVLLLTVKNVFDRQYIEQGSFGVHPRWGRVAGFAESGRDVRAAVALRF